MHDAFREGSDRACAIHRNLGLPGRTLLRAEVEQKALRVVGRQREAVGGKGLPNLAPLGRRVVCFGVDAQVVGRIHHDRLDQPTFGQQRFDFPGRPRTRRGEQDDQPSLVHESLDGMLPLVVAHQNPTRTHVFEWFTQRHQRTDRAQRSFDLGFELEAIRAHGQDTGARCTEALHSHEPVLLGTDVIGRCEWAKVERERNGRGLTSFERRPDLIGTDIPQMLFEPPFQLVERLRYVQSRQKDGDEQEQRQSPPKPGTLRNDAGDERAEHQAQDETQRTKDAAYAKFGWGVDPTGDLLEHSGRLTDLSDGAFLLPAQCIFDNAGPGRVRTDADFRRGPYSVGVTSVVWFRNDLRTDDHGPLRAAVRLGTPVIPVVCVDVDLARSKQFGIPRLGPHRAKFWLACIEDLRRDLRARGSDLIVLRGRATDVLPALIERHAVKEVFFHHAFAIDECREETRLAERCPQVRWTGCWGNALITPDLAPFPIEQLPETFTVFRKKVEARVEIPRAEPPPARVSPPPTIDPGDIPVLADFGLTAPEPDVRAQLTYVGGHTAGAGRMRAYVWEQDRLRVYKQTRNGMLRANDSSKFSPWLAHGALSPRQILDEVRAYEEQRVANDSTYWLFFELLWRDYFQLIAHKHGAQLFKQAGLRNRQRAWRTDADRIDAWCRGQTGYPLVDASMRELAATGYTSNRARQNVASFFTKVLQQDWRVGAAWFERSLIDYDPASNWGNWAYNAGVGNDARDNRYFHIPKQARTYDPNGEFVRHWLPELKDVPVEWLPAPHRAPGDVQSRVGIGERYPYPIVDLPRP